MGMEGNTALMLMDMEQEHPHYEKLLNLRKYIQAGADLTNNMRNPRDGCSEGRKPSFSSMMRKGSWMSAA
jgi:hypothetical protein